MRICLVSNYFGPLDEGMGNAAFHLHKELSKRHQVLLLSLSNIFSPGFWLSLKRFKPQIIHYVPGPTLLSFVIDKTISLYCRDARMVMSAFAPVIPLFLHWYVAWLRPDLVLTQSRNSDQFFQKAGCKTRFLPCGVDTEKFSPVPEEIRNSLRVKYGIDKEQFIALHIGTIRRGRNVQVLGGVQGDDNQVLIVGRTSRAPDKGLSQELRRQGCILWLKYFDNIEEAYALADCYLFPTVKRGNSIELPLTVMEAMSCNLPVICTRFGALSEVFGEGDGLHFVESLDDFKHCLRQVKANNLEIKTREKVLPYTWEEVARRLEEIYGEIMGG